MLSKKQRSPLFSGTELPKGRYPYTALSALLNFATRSQNQEESRANRAVFEHGTGNFQDSKVRQNKDRMCITTDLLQMAFAEQSLQKQIILRFARLLSTLPGLCFSGKTQT